MDIRHFAASIARLLTFSHTINRPGTNVHLIINPVAGGFRTGRSRKAIVDTLKEIIHQRGSGEQDRRFQFNTYMTEHRGHAREIISCIAREPYDGSTEPEEIVITAGGDGTATEVCSALLEQEASIRERFSLFRLPLGTGNDGLEAETIVSAWRLLTEPLTRVKKGYVMVQPNNDEPSYAFNIASIGLDAYVTELTNTFKSVFPGSFYTLMVNVAALFYEKKIDVRPFSLDVVYEGNVRTVHVSFLLLAFGESGYRSYGGGKKVLPGPENVCIVKPMKLLRKFNVMPIVYKGEHKGLPEFDLFPADNITIRYDSRIPLQCDGEVRWMETDHFPLTLRRMPPSLYVLRKS